MGQLAWEVERRAEAHHVRARNSAIARKTLQRCFWCTHAPTLPPHSPPKHKHTLAAATGEAVSLPGSADDAVLVRLPQRPYGATAELPESAEALVSSSGARRVGVLREAFAPAGAAPQEIGRVRGSHPLLLMRSGDASCGLGVWVVVDRLIACWLLAGRSSISSTTTSHPHPPPLPLLPPLLLLADNNANKPG